MPKGPWLHITQRSVVDTSVSTLYDARMDSTDDEIASLRRQLKRWIEVADEIARSMQTAGRDLQTAEDKIGDIEADLRRLGVDV